MPDYDYYDDIFNIVFSKISKTYGKFAHVQKTFSDRLETYISETMIIDDLH